MNKNVLKLICILSAAVLILCGCSWSSKEMPQVAKTEKVELILSAPIMHSGNLTSTDGSIIAEYYAAYPQFQENCRTAKNINSTFSILAEGAVVDMTSFFNHVKTQLGENWESQSFSTPFHSIKMEYTLVPSLSEYVCFASNYVITEDGTEKVYPRVNLFLSSTGWSLNYETLFGENTSVATEQLISQLKEWCKNNKVPTDALSTLNSKSFNGIFGITNDTVFVCFDPYFFSTQFSECIIVHFPLAPYKGLFIEQINK